MACARSSSRPRCAAHENPSGDARQDAHSRNPRAAANYIRRIEHYAEVQITELRDASAWRKQKLDSHAAIVALDAAGKQFTSQQFAKWLGTQRDSGLRELVILCGDADGFPAELRTAAKTKISLSTLTMPHELARVLIAEQIYQRLRHPRRAPVSEIIAASW